MHRSQYLCRVGVLLKARSLSIHNFPDMHKLCTDRLAGFFVLGVVTAEKSDSVVVLEIILEIEFPILPLK